MTVLLLIALGVGSAVLGLAAHLLVRRLTPASQEEEPQLLSPYTLAALEHECLEERPAEAWGHPRFCATCYPPLAQPLRPGGYIQAGSITADKITLDNRQPVVLHEGMEVHEIKVWGQPDPIAVIGNCSHRFVRTELSDGEVFERCVNCGSVRDA